MNANPPKCLQPRRRRLALTAIHQKPPPPHPSPSPSPRGTTRGFANARSAAVVGMPPGMERRGLRFFTAGAGGRHFPASVTDSGRARRCGTEWGFSGRRGRRMWAWYRLTKLALYWLSGVDTPPTFPCRTRWFIVRHSSFPIVPNFRFQPQPPPSAPYGTEPASP
ncbi:hypothetical protein EJ06DRAFT_90804 [Trichodelitschia bisporula]|uniref:Uncharacterized protein n=1 Tax=Trichodelitschia bisporula TaxID=703511 RepID=A0A6G1HSP1_9PEZI|nr:hypothetical protein EJ06DRAFT_90804 [Trichodelitschia bisporula]